MEYNLDQITFDIYIEKNVQKKINFYKNLVYFLSV